MDMVDQELVNASYMLGRSEFQTAIRVVLPYREEESWQGPRWPLREPWANLVRP